MYPAGQGDRAERPSRSSGRCRGARATAGAHSEAHVRAQRADVRARVKPRAPHVRSWCAARRSWCAARTELVRRTYGVGAPHVWSTCDASGAYARARRGAGAPWPLGWTRPLGEPTLPKLIKFLARATRTSTTRRDGQYNASRTSLLSRAARIMRNSHLLLAHSHGRCCG